MKKLFKSIKSIIGNKTPKETGPPVDLYTPITNPALFEALEKLSQERSIENTRIVRSELQKAIYLVPAHTDEMNTTEPSADGSVTILTDSQIKILLTSDPSGIPYLPLFTDWEEIRKFTETQVNTLVFPASEAWSFALNNEEYGGVVINPCGISMPLSRNAVIQLQNEQQDA